ncbi:MAG: MmgE/PrpD family protein [Candidatus Bathyarchaeia archaeon]
MSSVTERLAEYVIGFTFSEVPEEVVKQAKKVVLDTIGCAIGAYESKARRILEDYTLELGAKGESTLIGSGFRTSCELASLVNGAAVRYLDFNDTAYIVKDGIYRTGYHPSEIIPPILAVAESTHRSGEEVLACIILGYNLSISFLEAVTGEGLEKSGWNGDLRGAYIVPLVVGKLLGLSKTELINAVGISASCQAVLGILDSPGEEYTMTKNVRFPFMACRGIKAARLAKKGFTGPVTIFEGKNGFLETIMRGQYDLERVVPEKGRFAIMETCLKSIIADYSSHGHLWATLELVKEHDLKPEEIKEVKIVTSKRCAEHTGDPVKKYPRNKETADHSSYFLTAVAIADREIGPDQFKEEKFTDPKILALIDKVTIVGDSSLDRVRPAGVSEIITHDGRRFAKRVDYPRGHAKNPMSDEEVIAKFKSMARRWMKEEEMEKLIGTIYELENLKDIRELMELTVFSEGR